MSIRMRLTLWYSTILALMLLLFGVVLYFTLSLKMNYDAESRLKTYADDVYDRIEVGAILSFKGSLQLDIKLDEIDTFLSNEYYLQVINLNKKEVTKSRNSIQQHVQIPFPSDYKKVKEGERYFETEKIDGRTFLIYNIPIRVKFNNSVTSTGGLLQAAVYTGNNEAFFDYFKIRLLLLSFITILVAATIGWLLARKTLKPIDHLIAETDQIEKGADLEKRIQYEGSKDDEIAQLAKTINGMLSRIQTAYTELDTAYRAQRRFVSDASHELRTPLTTIRGNVQLLEKMWKSTTNREQLLDEENMTLSLESMRDIASEAERMTRLVNDLLSLARADAGFEMNKERVELKPLVDEVVRRAQFLPKNVEWRVGDLSSLEGVTVNGNQDYLQQLLFIFIENAFKYTLEGYVQLDSVRSEQQIGIQIADTGIGMDKGEVPNIFERFYRADPSRGQTTGTGLGLSIAKWIIDEHGGSIEVTTSKGVGTTFTIWLPANFPLIED